MRILTRSDFDGLGCCVLLMKVGIADEIKFVHPKDMQDGKVAVTSNDIICNVPYVEGCGMWFDHHISEQERHDMVGKVSGEFRPAPSAARVIYDYYGGKDKYPDLEEMVNAVDKADSGQFDRLEILKPTGWVLLSFVMDPRTGLGRYHDYRISNYELMLNLIDHCGKLTIDEILELPDIKERVDRYKVHSELFKVMVRNNSVVKENLILTDLRNQKEIFSGNRFMVYALYPTQNISIWLIDGKEKKNAVFAMGHSILNRTSKTNVGSLMLEYGGGGHEKVGTCQILYKDADKVREELIARIVADG